MLEVGSTSEAVFLSRSKSRIETTGDGGGWWAVRGRGEGVQHQQPFLQVGLLFFILQKTKIFICQCLYQAMSTGINNQHSSLLMELILLQFRKVELLVLTHKSNE